VANAAEQPFHATLVFISGEKRRAAMQATREQRGILPGALTPDFELPRVDDANMRLSELRGKPTLLHFGSLT
jgi:hypothetical protein